MVAVAGGIHGTMYALEQRMSIMEVSFSKLPPDIGEHWQHVIDMIKTLKQEAAATKEESEYHKKEIIQMTKSEELSKQKICGRK